MLSMQHGCILSVNVILHARVVSDARFNAAVVTQNEKSTLSRIIFSLLHYYRTSAGLQVSPFVCIELVPGARIVSII